MSKNLLGEYIAELTDFTANGSFADLRENVKYYNEYNYAALVRTTDLDKYNFQPEVFTDKNGYEFLVKSRLFGGEIIVANVGSVGKVFKVPYYSLPMTLGPNAYLVRFDKDKIDQEYAYQFLISDFFKTELYRKIGSTTLQAINKDNFRSIELFVPNDINNQQRIAKILSTADAVIEKTQAAIAKYKAIKQGMLQDLFTRGIDLNTNKLRPRYQDAPGLYKESKLGWIPREWDEKNIESIGEIVTGSTPPTARVEYYGDAFLFVSPADIQDNFFIQETGKKLTQSGFDVTRKLPVNSICVVCIGSTIGKMALLAKEGCTNQQINSVICHDPELSFYFFYAMMFYNEPQFRRETGLQAVPIVNKSQFSEFLLPVAEKREALKISERLKAIDNKLQTEQTYLQKMQSLKKGLMEDLLSGRKQVKVSEPLIVTD